MPVIDVEKFFSASSKSVRNLFIEPGAAFYIPAYQRQYRWKKENVKQLVDDVVQGVNSLLDISPDQIEEHKRSTRFFGTVILVNETSPWATIRPKQSEGMPTKVRKIIDGQQRLSTYSIVAVLLHSRINKHLVSIKSKNSKVSADIVKKLEESAVPYLEDLSDLYSSDFKKGVPRRKPVIIRGSSDRWVYEADVDENYQSVLANYLAKYIGSCQSEEYDAAYSGSHEQLGDTISVIDGELSNIEKAHQGRSNFPSADSIVESVNQQDLWGRTRDDLVQGIQAYSLLSSLHKSQSSVCSLTQLFMFSHYILHRCCFTTIELNDENLAFDIFQSLNSTGTPLTSIETFQPHVMNLADDLDGGYEGSDIQLYFKKVNNLFDGNGSHDKGSLTNDFLNILALVYNGERLGNPFSEQRNFLLKHYPKSENTQGHEERLRFVTSMGLLAQYWEHTQLKAIQGNLGLDILSPSQLDEVKLHLTYLKDANHKLSSSVIGRYYLEVKSGDLTSQTDFLEVAKAVSAFFTLWRAARSNSGLDAIYRKILREHLSVVKVGTGPMLSAGDLKSLLLRELKAASIGNESTWGAEAVKNFSMSTAPKSVCRFALLAVFTDMMEDTDRPGLLAPAAPGYAPYLTYENWRSPNLNTLEHVAPQTPTLGWDAELYIERRFNRIGNLTLLPTSINSSAGNRGWREKWYYYSYMAEGSMSKRVKLGADAAAEGITLSKETLEKLTNAKFAQHMKPLVELGKDARWDHAFVETRTAQICEILWSRMYAWLS